MGRIAGILIALLLAGCAKPLEVGSITEIQPLNGATGVDVYSQQRQAGDIAAPQFAGDQLVEVRTYAVLPEKGETEIAGASCTLSAANYAANMVSPAKVRVPLYRSQSSTLAVKCEMPGYQAKMISLSPIDVTRQQRLASGSGGGLVGALTVVAIDSFSDNSQNQWAYPVAKLLLEKE